MSRQQEQAQAEVYCPMISEVRYLDQCPGCRFYNGIMLLQREGKCWLRCQYSGATSGRAFTRT